jgi:NADPH:quinone reductase-like Zn-dependent oxidoreductase
VDIIIDPIAGPTIPDNIRLLAPCGILVVYGALGGKAQHDLQATLRLNQELSSGQAIHYPYLG